MIQLMWSGGVESTSLLKLLLETTNEPIMAHFVRMDYQEDRKTLVEDTVIAHLLPEMTKIRSFKLYKSYVQIADHTVTPADHEILYPFALLTHRAHRCSASYRALCAEDAKNWNLDPIPYHAWRAGLVAPMLKSSETLESVLPFHYTYAWPKSKHLENLGALAELTMSCHNPIRGKPCNHCKKCAERRIAMGVPVRDLIPNPITNHSGPVV